MTAAWQHYYATLAAAEEALRSTDRFNRSDHDRAQAYYVLLEAQAMAYNFAIAPRPDHPRPYVHTSWNTYLYTLGQGSPDNYYCTLLLDGTRTYRMTGSLGDVPVAVMQVFNHLPGHPDHRCIGNHDFQSFAGSDGRFEVVLSAAEHDGNWIPLAGDSHDNFILHRRWLSDWFDDTGSLHIDVTGDEPSPQDPEKAMAARVLLAADLIRYLVEQWSIGLHDMYLNANAQERNTLALVPGETIASSDAGNGLCNYAFGVFELEPDEALLLELEPPDSSYWSFQLGDVWSKTIDSVYRQTDINMLRAVPDADGKIRLVIAHTDPGVPNWLDPVGRREGTVVFRNYRSAAPAVPTARLVAAEDVRKHLPPDTATITADERRAVLEHRRLGQFRLYGPVEGTQGRRDVT